MKTVMIDLTSLADNFSGIERFALSITKELIKEKTIKFILIFKNQVHNSFMDKQGNVETIIIKGKNKLFFNQVKLPLKLLGIHADAYLFLAFPAPFLFFKKNAISAIHDMGCWDCPQTNKWWMNLYFRLLYRKAAWGGKQLITVSEFSSNRIQNVLHVKPENLHVIYNGISDVFLQFKYDKRIHESIKKKYSLPDKYILCLSTIEPRKNIKLLVDAYENLLHEKRMESLDLVLAGRNGWKNQELYKKISEHDDRIHFTGFVEDQDLPYVYCGAKCFVFPSIYEGFGIPPIEALASGVSVLSSDAASMPEILRDNAMFFKNNDRDDLENKLLEVLEKEPPINNVELRQRYNWSQQADKVMKEILL